MVDLLAPTTQARLDGAPTLVGAVSPGAHLAERFVAAEVTGTRAVSMREVPFSTMVGVRVVPATAAGDRVGDALGLALPTGVGQVAAGERGCVLWFGPDELLVVSDEASASLTVDLVEALGAAPGAVVDLSANRTTFELVGPGVRAVLQKGCALDLHPRAFAVGSAFLTLVGGVPVALWRVAEETWRLMPRSSYADFLGRWLLDAVVELAGPELGSWR